MDLFFDSKLLWEDYLKKFLKNSLSNNRGQSVLEYVLITFVLIGITIAVKEALVSSGAVTDLVKKPWGRVAGMIESGVWEEPAKARTQHPGHFKRHLSFRGDTE